MKTLSTVIVSCILGYVVFALGFICGCRYYKMSKANKSDTIVKVEYKK